MEISKESVHIKTGDDVSLSALLLAPKAQSVRGVVQFHSGTVMPKEYYLKLSKYISSQGYIVALFDYRGVGESRPKSLKNYKATIHDWGCRDAYAVLDYLKCRYPQHPIHLIAHSMGGQLLGLMPNWSDFDKIIVLSSSSGNWHNFETKSRRKSSLSTRLTFPIYLALYGYIPGKFGMGYDWPKGVAQDWWYNSKADSLMAHYMEKNYGPSYYNIVDKRITAWFFSDDHMATPKTIDNYQLSFPKAKVTTRLIEPSEFRMDSIGHFGLFKEKSRETLWPELAALLQSD